MSYLLFVLLHPLLIFVRLIKQAMHMVGHAINYPHRASCFDKLFSHFVKQQDFTSRVYQWVSFFGCPNCMYPYFNKRMWHVYNSVIYVIKPLKRLVVAAFLHSPWFNFKPLKRLAMPGFPHSPWFKPWAIEPWDMRLPTI